MRILYITQTFPPEPGSTKRPLQQAICLQRLGHKVTILTSMPSYPLGRVFPGYRGRLFLREAMQGVEVVRVWSLPAPNRGKIRRMLSYASFGVASTITGTLLGRYDLVIASVPNMATELAGVLVGHLRRTPILLELRDLLPDSLALAGFREDSLSLRVLGSYFRWIFRHVDGIAIPGPRMADVLIERKVARDSILLLPHGADPELFPRNQRQQIRRELCLDDRFVVMYAGSFSPYYDVSNMVEAASQLVTRAPQIQWVLLGTGAEASKVREIVAQRNLTNVSLIGSVSPQEAGRYMVAADLFITSLARTNMPDFYRDLPITKVCEYLMAGRPTISVEGSPLLGGFLERIGAGFGVPAKDPGALARAVERFACQPELCETCGQRASEYAQTHLERQAIVSQFEQQLAQRLRKRSSRCRRD